MRVGVESGGGMSARNKYHWNQRILTETMHARWYLRFRRLKEEALDLRRSSNMRRSLYVAASWGGWKDPLGIMVGGINLGGMTFETDARASGRASPKARFSIRSPSWECGDKGRKGRCRRLSRRVVVIKGHHTTSRLCSSRVRLERTIAAEPHAAHRPGNPGGGGSLRFSHCSLQKLRCAFGKTRNYRLSSLLTFGSVDLGEQQEEERSLSSSERRSGCPRKNRIQDTLEERR